MSRNLLKRGYTNLLQEETRVINTNELAAKRIEELAVKMQQEENVGFVSGIPAQTVEADGDTNADEVAVGTESGNVIKARDEAEQVKAAAHAQAEEIMEQAKVQAQQLLQDAQTQAEQEKALHLERARQEGLQEGRRQAQKEAEEGKRQLKEKEAALEAEYQKRMDELEPQFVDTITGIYEHIFHVELRSYREVLCYLISTTMRKVEGNRSFLIHVSKEDYPYISMQKKQLAAGATAPNSSVEIVEDISLSRNECLIETEGGIFDCGLGTQLTELRQKLKLLSYEK